MTGARRLTGAIAAVACLAALAACSSTPEPSGSVAPTASPTATPTAGPSPSPSTTTPGVPPEFQRRDPGMSDGEALARLANPQTGETWFVEPRAIAAPSWAADDPYLGDPSVFWFELGTRGDRTIVGYADEYIQELFERAPDGTWAWIGAPSARDEVEGGTGATFGFPEVPLDETIYYDSLTLPSAFELPSGGALEVPDHDRGGLANPGYTVVSQPDGIVVDSIGGYDVLRYSTQVLFVWEQYYAVDAPEGVTYRDVYYMLSTPYGTFIPLYYYPFGALSDVDWTVPTTFQNDDFSYLADLNDIACGIWERDHNTIVEGIPASAWSVGGTAPDGANVYVPVAANPLAEPLYEAYRENREDAGATPVSIGEFLAAPAFVGYRVGGAGEWLVYLNGTYSARAWC